MLIDFEFWVSILAILGFIWSLTSFGKFIAFLMELKK
jgi:hypothetical protein